MMRAKLQKIDGLRKEFTGTFVRFGTKSSFKGYPETTILLQDVKCIADKRICCGHLWFNFTKEFQKINLQEGDLVNFQARVKDYWKGYAGYKEEIQWERPVERDYRLNYPTKIRLMKRKEEVIRK